METYWKILYTTQKHKKQTKKWIDGYMHVKPDGKNAVMYSEDLDKIHHFRIEQKFRCRITEGGEFGIQKYDLQVDEQLSKLPTGKIK
ncbi:Oidioi.mRNA.OKI2018_I69.XSR.g14940.t1.cds [Oikopleura dioica]|uniref:Oidioi.mRNA.OKI2018_I69.XSR.g14940.t1.cds n=1 Tax=Oikopleura dioica TaxID=34765 RepID=A0ABN7SKB3_OIKDI|nr:Oidioi.mRNA.OKI2018_I69.XSR.g14940.t1.cds [Oikopleura dioica]